LWTVHPRSAIPARFAEPLRNVALRHKLAARRVSYKCRAAI
jgi:hypothetical protein